MITRFRSLFVIPLLVSSGCLSGLTVKEEPPEGWGGGGGTGGGSGGMAGAGGGCGNGYACVGLVPPGWDGYYRIRTMPYMEQPLDGCPDGAMGLTYFTKPSTSTPCQCSCSFDGATCSAPKLDCFWSAGCLGTPDFSDQSVDESCIPDLPGSNGNSSCRIAAESYLVSPGTCTAMTEKMSTPPFEDQHHLCRVQFESKCGNGGQCMITDFEPYDVSVCVIGDVSNACPSGFTNEMQAYTSGTDMRACSGCTCDTSAITCSGGSYLAHEGDACNGITKTVSGGGTCVDVGTYLDADTGSLRPQRGIPSAGGCSGAVSTGSVVPEGPKKICCRKF
jgi:hypothetical protein